MKKSHDISNFVVKFLFLYIFGNLLSGVDTQNDPHAPIRATWGKNIFFVTPPSIPHLSTFIQVAKALHEQGDYNLYFLSETEKSKLYIEEKFPSAIIIYRPDQNRTFEKCSETLLSLLDRDPFSIFNNLDIMDENVLSLQKHYRRLLHDIYETHMFHMTISDYLLVDVAFSASLPHGKPFVILQTTPASITNEMFVQTGVFQKIREAFNMVSIALPAIVKGYWDGSGTPFLTKLNLIGNVMNFAPVLINTISAFESYRVPFNHKRIGFIVDMTLNENISENDKRAMEILNNNEEVIYVSFGTIVNLEKERVNNLLKALAEGTQHVIIALRDEIINDYNIPKVHHIHVFNWVNQKLILQHDNVKFFITHGGKTSIFESIYMEKPMLVLPYQPEQYSTAFKISQVKMGIMINENINVNEYKKEIKKMNKMCEKFIVVVKYMKEKSIKNDGTLKAVKYIERIMRKKKVDVYEKVYENTYTGILLGISLLVISLGCLVALCFGCRSIYRSILAGKNKIE